MSCLTGYCAGTPPPIRRPPIAESVLEWTITRDSRDIRQLMVWMEESEGRKERAIFMSRALDLMDEIQYALSRLDELR